MATKKTRKPTVSPTTDDSLRLSQETLRAIIDTAVDGIITIDGRGTMLTMNPAAEKLFGYRSEEVIGRNVKMLMPAPFREAHDGYLKNYLDTGNKKIIGIGREVVGTRKDGSTFPLYLGVGEMKIGDKHYFTGITRDLSDIKNAERKLRETNEELKSQVWIRQGEAELYERMRGEQALAELSRNILSFLCEYLDARVGAIYLKSDEQLKRSAVYAYSSGDGKESFGLGEGLVGQVAVDHKPILLDHVPSNYIKVTSAIGEGSPASVLILPLLYEGKIQGVLELGFLERIDAAGSKMSFLQGVTDSIGIGINSSKSRRLAELLAETQRQAEELQMQQEELRVTNEELETQTTALRRSQARLQAQQEELQQINAELEERTKAIEEQRETLKQKNAELSRTQEDLEEKARQLELSGKYKSEFLANMSHELRTPLNSILILAKLLVENRQQNLTKEQVDFAATIQTSGVALVTLINDILDLAKVEAGRLEIRPEPVELTELAASMESSFRMDAKGRNLGFEIDVQPGLSPSIRTDRSRVEQILRNLISNALKFTKQGEVKLRLFKPDPASVPAKLSADSRRTIAFEVADTGVGISKDFQKVIFEPFRQADGTTSRKYGGTGLGLAISRELASLLGGDILIDSEEGKGSRFTLFLPEEFREAAVKPEVTVFQEKDKAVGVPSASRGTDSAATAPIARKGVTAPQAEKTVLIIEDDPGFSKVLSALAEERGFKSIVAGDGERGLECLETSIPSGILLDLKLPGIDGLSVLERIKADPRTRHVPVHIISGAEAESESLRKGAMGFLHKPVDEDDLREAFTRIEALAFRKVKRLLVVEDDPIQRESIVSLIRGAEVEIYTAATAKQAYDYLKTQSVDCMVVDLGLPDFSGFEFLEQIAHDESISAPPIIVYTARDLTRAEEQKLKTYSSSIIIKGARSPERLLDEVSLFLHQVEDKLPKEKQRILLRVRDEVFQNKKVLLVDDDMRNVYALSSVLEDRGLQVLVAKNGHEALAQLEATPTIDLVLMDIMMPEMDGYEAMREIRKQRRFQTLPILAITAKAMQEDRKKCLDAGANDYIPKPINVDQLLTLLRVWLSRHV